MARLRDVTRYVTLLAYVFAHWRHPQLYTVGSASWMTRPTPFAAMPLAPPALGAEPNPGVVPDEWMLSQVVCDEEAEAPIPAAVLQVEDGSSLDKAVVPPNQELDGLPDRPGCSSCCTSRGCPILVPYMGSV